MSGGTWVDGFLDSLDDEYPDSVITTEGTQTMSKDKAFTWEKMVKHLSDMDLKFPSNEDFMNDFGSWKTRPLFEHEPKREPMTRFQTFAYGTQVLKPDSRMLVGVDCGSDGGDRTVHTMNGLRIIYSEHVMDRTGKRLFPESRHRSKRILKKLIKRFGGERELAPAVLKSGNVFYVHPYFKEELERGIANA